MGRIITQISAAILLLFLLPILLVLVLKFKQELGSPIFFRQMRVGKDGKPFQMIKFRTMLDAYDENGEPLVDSERMTSFGTFLRSTSLDELPELWNVIKGEMSFVGPRPLLLEYLPLYSKEQARRHEVTPGITGWAQVNGRNAISWEERLKLDVWYVENRTVVLDLKIIFLTVWKVLIKENISAGDDVTMSKFTGED